MTAMYEDIYDHLLTFMEDDGLLSAENGLQRRAAEKLPDIKQAINKWQDITRFETVPLEDEEWARAFCAILRSRAGKDYRYPNRGVTTLVIGQRHDGTIIFNAGNAYVGKFQGDEGIITNEDLVNGLNNEGSQFFRRLEIKGRELEEAQQFFAENYRPVADRLYNILNNQCQKMNLRRFSKPIGTAARDIAQDVMMEHFDTAYEAFLAEHINQEDYEFCKTFGNRSPYTSIEIYNHLQQSPTAQAKEFRKGALQVLNNYCGLHSLFFFETPNVWASIDEGKSPYQAIAEHVDIRPSTVKHILKHYKSLANEIDFESVAPFLDKIEPDLWPKDEQAPTYKTDEHGYFAHLRRMADTFGKTFARSPQDTLKRWLHETQKPKNWRRVFEHVTHKQMAEYQEKTLADFGNIRHYTTGKARIDLETRLSDMGADFQSAVLSDKLLVDETETVYSRYIRDIQDMHKDVEKRLLSPLVILELDKHDIVVTDADCLSNTIEQIRANLWQKMAPSDQVAASAYWHSPHVNIKERFKSAVLGERDDFKEWCPLFSQDYYEAENGVRLYPLSSATALEEEGCLMSHCVGSYSSYCYTMNYHIFSVRDASGNRLTTLTVQDYRDTDENKRQIKEVHNLAYKNRSPDSASIAAVQDFIESANQGEIKVDWPAIDEARMEYKQRQIENAAGYDFRDAEQRQSVMDVYKPCLPKRVIKDADGHFDQLPVALDLDRTVAEFVRNYDFTSGGLILRDNDKETDQTPPQRPLAL